RAWARAFARLIAEPRVGGSITGTMTGQSGPQRQACVLAVPTNPDNSYPFAFTDASGDYVMSGLAAGTYRVDLVRHGRSVPRRCRSRLRPGSRSRCRDHHVQRPVPTARPVSWPIQD